MQIRESDRAMLVDLLAVTRQLAIEPCLIGAMALHLGATRWLARPLLRTTLDWDFAVAVDGWHPFEALASRLGAVAGFSRTAAPHRFRHRTGGTIDLVPFGSIARPDDTIAWSDGTVMSIVGFSALRSSREVMDLGGGLSMWVATLPVLAGLKLIAYGDRRPAVLRDIRDQHHLARWYPWQDPGGTVSAEAERALLTGISGFDQLGAFCLGCAIGRAFDPDALRCMRALLGDVADPFGDLVEDVVRERSGPIEDEERAAVAARFMALLAGIEAL